MRVALACRDAAPGAVTEPGRTTLATARVLAAVEDVDVTLFVSERVRERFADDRADLSIVFVAEPAEAGPFLSCDQRYGANLLAALRHAYGAHGPDLVEVPDRGGEGAAIVQARLTRDPFLRETCVAARAHGTDEMLGVLDGWLADDRPARLRHELERTTLRHADVRLLPAAGVDGAYRAFYADEALAPSAVVRPGARPVAAAPPRPPLAGRALRLLLPGPLDPRSGAPTLLAALLGLEAEIGAWELTVAGPDTCGGSLGTSVRGQLELAAAGDPRVTFAADDAEHAALLADHDVVVLPARWDCWPPAALDALLADRPLLAVPTGGRRELAAPGGSGWLSADDSADALAAAVADLLERPERYDALVRAGGPRRTGEALTRPDAVVAAYRSMVARAGARPASPRRDAPLVSVVIPYFRHAAFVERAVASAFTQTHREIEVLVVSDGSTERADTHLDELASRWPIALLAQENQGVGAARNFGIAQASGEYVLPLDADNELDPRFAERAVAALEGEPRLAWISSWTRYVDGQGATGDAEDGYHPLAGHGPELAQTNIAADATALMRRELFELGFRYRSDVPSLEDWLLYRELASAGHLGAIVPERLIRYRVLPTSKLRSIGMQNTERLLGELRAREREGALAWT